MMDCPAWRCIIFYRTKKGYIWIATSKGVSRFDGNRFENFTVENGLPDNEVLRICEDAHSRIWFAEGKGQLSVYDMIGQQLLVQDLAVMTGSNNFKLDLSKLAKGAYTVRVIYNGLSRNCKLIVE
ncbi:MAG: two-component regulator propeller domain-containing protein [Bacteroidia bacterium]